MRGPVALACLRHPLVLPYLLLLALLCASFTALSAQSSVTIVPQGLSFTGLTPDGQVALLHNYPTQETWLWTEAGGLQPIGLAVAAQGLSADGQTVAGSRDFRWPQGVPSGMSMTWQVWVADASGPAGFAATNALQSIAP